MSVINQASCTLQIITIYLDLLKREMEEVCGWSLLEYCCLQSMIIDQHCNRLASYPVPRPAFRRCLVLSSDEKLGVGLGTRLVIGDLHHLNDASHALYLINAERELASGGIK